MASSFRWLSCALLALLLVLPAPSTPATPAPFSPAQAAQEMPTELMSAFLAASSQPFEASADGYHAHSGGLDFTLRASGLHARADGLAWGLTLTGVGRGKEIAAPPEATIVQTDNWLECRRGELTEWYRDTALGVEQRFTVRRRPAGQGPFVLQFTLSTDLTSTLDADGRGLSFTTPDGRTLRYDHLRAWDADGTPLDATLRYAFGQVTIQVDDQGAVYPITVDPLIYVGQKVTASYGAAWDEFGYSVALSGDGNTALVGAYLDDVGAAVNQGSAYVFTRSGTVWTMQQRLTAADGEADDRFGRSVALASDGNTALVGANQDNVGANVNQGSATVFTRSGTTWTQQAQLIAADGAAEDAFGISVALSSDTALVGARLDDVGAVVNQGSAYVFTRSGATWTQQAQLTAADGASSDFFGFSVALSGDTALVGAPNDNVGANADQGSAYVFTRSGATWTQQAQLTAADGAPSDSFGFSVALSGDTALVGAPGDDIGLKLNQGSATVFTRSGTTWSQQDQLTAADGAANDGFGGSVALSEDGNTALVGANLDDVGANSDQGSAYVFTRSGATWNQQAQLIASAGAPSDGFGNSVALSGNTALVGADGDDIGANADQGSATVFIRDGTTWSQQAQLTASGGLAGDHFGWSVALSGDTALVGEPGYDSPASDAGTAFLFTRSGTTWTEQGGFYPIEVAANDNFGASVALSGDGHTVLVGAYLDDVGANVDQGTAYFCTLLLVRTYLPLVLRNAP